MRLIFVLQKAALCAGLGVVHDGQLEVPWLGKRYGLSVVTTDLPLAHDKRLAPLDKAARL